MATLELRGVARTYRSDPPVEAVRGIDLSVESGSYLALTGPSGSGKSTLLNLIALIDRPTAGIYEIGAHPTSELSEVERTRLRSDTFGFIFQTFHLMARRSALENVELGLIYRGLPRRIRRELAARSLAAVGLADRQDIAAGKLSGGEQQRVAIARATVGGAPIVVADEPTGNLDTGTGATIVNQLTALNATGTTVLLVTHDHDVAASAQRRVHVQDGRIVRDEVGSNVPDHGAHIDHVPAVPGRAATLRRSDLVRESGYAMAGRPGRTALLVAAVGLAVALVVVTLGLSQTASAQVSERFDLHRNREVTLNLPTDSSPDMDAMPANIERRLGQVRGITAAGVVERHEPVAASNPGLRMLSSVGISGLSPDALDAVGAVARWAVGSKHRMGRHEVLVGTTVAEDLGLGPLELDPVIELGGTTYAVVGIIREGGRAPDLASTVAVDIRYAAELSDLDSAKVYLVTAPGAAQQVAAQAPVAIDPVRAEQIEVRAPIDPSQLRAAVQADVRVSLFAFTVVACIVATLGVANAMLLGVIERIGEFGLRRAIGARPAHILGQTALESMFVGLIGGVAGFCAGLGAVLAVTIQQGWQPVLDLRLVPLALVGGAIVGSLGGLPASIRASRIQPADALRR